MSAPCTRCGKSIAATVFQPVVSVSRGTFHYDCFIEDAEEQRKAKRAHDEEVTEARKARARTQFAVQSAPATAPKGTTP
jgi:hypothetical protein